jgi:hypothetical protein
MYCFTGSSVRVQVEEFQLSFDSIQKARLFNYERINQSFLSYLVVQKLLDNYHKFIRFYSNDPVLEEKLRTPTFSAFRGVRAHLDGA